MSIPASEIPNGFTYLMLALVHHFTLNHVDVVSSIS